MKMNKMTVAETQKAMSKALCRNPSLLRREPNWSVDDEIDYPTEKNKKVKPSISRNKREGGYAGTKTYMNNPTKRHKRCHLFSLKRLNKNI